MKKRKSFEEILRYLRITKASITPTEIEIPKKHKVLSVSHDGGMVKTVSVGYAGDLIIAQALFPEKKFSRKEQELLTKIVEGFFYIKKSKPYEENLVLIEIFPVIGNIAKEVIKVDKIITASVKRDLKQSEKEILNKVMADKVAKEHIQDLEIDELWYTARGSGKYAESSLIKLRKIFRDSKRKQRFVMKLTLEQLMSSVAKKFYTR